MNRSRTTCWPPPPGEPETRPEELLKIHQRRHLSDVRAQAARKRSEKREIKSEEKALDEQVKQLRALLRQNTKKPSDALRRRSIEGCAPWISKGAQIRTRRRGVIEEIRQHAQAAALPVAGFQKAQRFYDRYYRELPAFLEGKEENR